MPACRVEISRPSLGTCEIVLPPTASHDPWDSVQSAQITIGVTSPRKWDAGVGVKVGHQDRTRNDGARIQRDVERSLLVLTRSEGGSQRVTLPEDREASRLQIHVNPATLLSGSCHRDGVSVGVSPGLVECRDDRRVAHDLFDIWEARRGTAVDRIIPVPGNDRSPVVWSDGHTFSSRLSVRNPAARQRGGSQNLNRVTDTLVLPRPSVAERQP